MSEEQRKLFELSPDDVSNIDYDLGNNNPFVKIGLKREILGNRYIRIFKDNGFHGINEAYNFFKSFYDHGYRKGYELRKIFTRCKVKFFKDGKFLKCKNIEYDENDEYYRSLNFFYVIGDTHFRHINTATAREFKSEEEHDNKIIFNINSSVPKFAEIIFLGDMDVVNDKFKLKLELDKIFCKNISLVKGNHDNLSDRDYIDCGFKHVYNKPILLEEYNVILSHQRIKNDIGCYKNIYAHDHKKEEITFKTCNATVESLNCIPQSVYEIVKEMNIMKPITIGKEPIL